MRIQFTAFVQNGVYFLEEPYETPKLGVTIQTTFCYALKSNYLENIIQ